jgi:hypothetical protein
MVSRRVAATLAAIGATVLLAVGATADRPAPHRPAIGFAEGTPTDLQALARTTWDRFLDAFPARVSCIGDVTVAGAWHLANRGRYDPDTRVATIRIPGPAAGLEDTLVHEFAHHLDFTCPGQRLLRPRFLEAQGLPPGSRWRAGKTWAQIPSEQFAEATVQLVLGRPSLQLVFVRPQAVQAIRRWGVGLAR